MGRKRETEREGWGERKRLKERSGEKERRQLHLDLYGSLQLSETGVSGVVNQ